MKKIIFVIFCISSLNAFADQSDQIIGDDGFPINAVNQNPPKDMNVPNGLVTPKYYIEHPASQVVDRGTIHCIPSQYSHPKPSHKYASDDLIGYCLGADNDAMADQEYVAKHGYPQ